MAPGGSYQVISRDKITLDVAYYKFFRPISFPLDFQTLDYAPFDFKQEIHKAYFSLVYILLGEHFILLHYAY